MKLLFKKLFLSLGLVAFILIQNAPFVFGQNPEDFDYVDPSGRYYTPVPVPDRPVPGDFDYTGPMPDSTPDPSYTPPSSTTKTPPSTTGDATFKIIRDVSISSQLAEIAGSCESLSNWTLKGCTAQMFSLVSIITGFIFWLSAVLLNVVASITLDAASWIGKTSSIGKAIQGVWQTLRDLANMFFIFVIIYTGISAMLNLGLVDTRKQIIKVITIAVFINFSLVITRVVIDASNIAAFGFYDAFPNAQTEVVGGKETKSLGILTDEINKSSDSPEVKATKIESMRRADLDYIPRETISYPPGAKNLAGPFMYVTKVTKIIGPGAGNKFAQAKAAAAKKGGEGSLIGAIIALLMLSILQIIGSFVLFAASILFITRTALLIVLMIISPIAFICYSTPKLEKYWKEWWDKLLHQAFFAPIFLGFLYVAAVIFTASTSNNFFNSGNTTSWEGLFGLIAALFIQFAMASAFMIIALLSAQSLGARGASTIVNWGNKKRKAIVGFAGRNTMGRAAHALSETDAMKNFALKHTLLGNFAKKKVGGVANAKYGGTVGYSDALKNYAKERGEMYDYATKDKYGNPIMVSTGKKDAEGNDIKITAAEYYAKKNPEAKRDDGRLARWFRPRSSIEAAKAVQKKHRGETDKGNRRKSIQDEINEIGNNESGKIATTNTEIARIDERIGELSRKAASENGKYFTQADRSEMDDLRARKIAAEQKIERMRDRAKDLELKIQEDVRQEKMAEGIEKTSTKESGGAKPETPKTT